MKQWASFIVVYNAKTLEVTETRQVSDAMPNRLDVERIAETAQNNPEIISKVEEMRKKWPQDYITVTTLEI